MRTPELYRRIGYDVEVEAEALECLSRLDRAGCLRALTRLAEGLDLSAAAGREGPVAHLLLDVLQRVNRRLPHRADEGNACEANRLALIHEFARCRSADGARRRFIAALGKLLGGEAATGSRSRALVDQAVRYIEQNYAKRISLSSIARHLHVSSGYLSRLFRRHTGTTVTALLHRVRQRNARALLADDRRSLSEIAYRVGYRNYRDFYRNFVKRERASPRQVRRRLSRDAARVS